MAIKELLKKNESVHNFFIDLKFNLEKALPDHIFIKRQYESETGKKLDLENPQTFNEKLQWLKLYWRDPVATKCADKYEVRNYVRERLGDEVLVKLYAVYDRVEDIDLEALPDSFVMRLTHGSGQNIICRNKQDMDWDQVFQKLRRNLKENYYYLAREWVYKDIVPRIVCEELLSEDGQPPKDYKFWCFNGVPRLVGVHCDRFISHKVNYYDLDWKLLDFRYSSLPSAKDRVVEKPKCFNRMVECATKLARGFPFVRTDLYYVNNSIRFGELTFLPGYGAALFNPDEYDNLYGSYLQLPARNH